jgi:hypothetical protein
MHSVYISGITARGLVPRVTHISVFHRCKHQSVLGVIIYMLTVFYDVNSSRPVFGVLQLISLAILVWHII